MNLQQIVRGQPRVRSGMSKLLAVSFAMLVGCAGRAAPPRGITTDATLELLPINSSGELTRGVHTGTAYLQIGLAERGDRTFLVRATGRITGVELLALPRRIPGVPAVLDDYQIDALRVVDTPANEMTLSASGSDGNDAYGVFWIVRWNPTRGAFELGEPQVIKRDRRSCEICSAA